MGVILSRPVDPTIVRLMRIGSLFTQTSMAQLEEDLAAFTTKDALNASLMWDIDRVHMRNRLPIFSSYDVGADWNGSGQIGERIP